MPKQPASFRRTRVRRSPAQWQQLIDDHAASGLSQKSFCTRKSIAYASFCAWRRKLLADAPMQRVAPQPAFVELTPPRSVGTPSTEGWDIELALGDGIVLRLHRR